MQAKPARLILGLVLLLGLAVPHSLFAETLNFASSAGSSIKFVGNGTSSTFTFPLAGTDLNITTESGFMAPGSLVGLTGDIAGSFSYTQASISSVTVAGTTYENASVLGTGLFVIHDGLGHDLTADLTWNKISTVSSGSATFGSVNGSGDINLTNFSYSGSNSQLQELASAPGAIATDSFQWNSGKYDLNYLASTHCNADLPCSTSNSGTVTVPEPASMFLLGTGLMGLVGLTRRRKQL